MDVDKVKKPVPLRPHTPIHAIGTGLAVAQDPTIHTPLLPKPPASGDTSTKKRKKKKAKFFGMRPITPPEIHRHVRRGSGSHGSHGDGGGYLPPSPPLGVHSDHQKIVINIPVPALKQEFLQYYREMQRNLFLCMSAAHISTMAEVVLVVYPTSSDRNKAYPIAGLESLVFAISLGGFLYYHFRKNSQKYSYSIPPAIPKDDAAQLPDGVTPENMTSIEWKLRQLLKCYDLAKHDYLKENYVVPLHKTLKFRGRNTVAFSLYLFSSFITFILAFSVPDTPFAYSIALMLSKASMLVLNMTYDGWVDYNNAYFKETFIFKKPHIDSDEEEEEEESKVTGFSPLSNHIFSLSTLAEMAPIFISDHDLKLTVFATIELVFCLLKFMMLYLRRKFLRYGLRDNNTKDMDVASIAAHVALIPSVTLLTITQLTIMLPEKLVEVITLLSVVILVMLKLFEAFFRYSKPAKILHLELECVKPHFFFKKRDGYTETTAPVYPKLAVRDEVIGDDSGSDHESSSEEEENKKEIIAGLFGQGTCDSPSNGGTHLFFSPAHALRDGTDELFKHAFKQLEKILKWKRSVRFINTTGDGRNLFGLERCEVHYKIGNCLFEAIAAGAGESGEQIRRKIVDFITVNTELRARIIALAGSQTTELRIASGEDVPYRNVDDYLELMSRDCTWGTQIELASAAHCLRKPLAILTPGNKYDFIIGDEDYAEGEPIFINWINNNHYEPLSISDGRAKREILKNIRENIALPKADRGYQAGAGAGGGEASAAGPMYDGTSPTYH